MFCFHTYLTLGVGGTTFWSLKCIVGVKHVHYLQVFVSDVVVNIMWCLIFNGGRFSSFQSRIYDSRNCYIHIPWLISKGNWTLQWRHNGCDGIPNHQPHHCLLNHLFRHRSKKTSKLRVTGLFAGNSPVTCEFPAQMASNAEDVSIWWHHHGFI